MLFVENDMIYLTRGDDAALEIDLTQNGEETYAMEAGDRLIFTVRTLPSPESPVLLRIAATQPRIVLRHEDTRDMNVGQYSADLQLITADGKRLTIWPELDEAQRKRVRNWKNMTIMPEVTIE